METYAFQKKTEKRTARARLTGINASFKDLCEVCRSVRYQETDYAIAFLERAAEGEQAIEMPRHGKGRGHVRQLGGKQGGWPVKSAKIVLGVVKSANANANKLGIGTTKVAHIIANKEHTFPRMSPKGRRIVHNYETAFVEVVLEEFQKKAADEKKAAGAKKADKPSAPVAKAEAKADMKRATSTGVKAATAADKPATQ